MRLKKNVKLFLIVIIIVTTAVITGNYITKKELCNNLIIEYTNSKKAKYIQPEIITNYITKKFGDIKQKPLSEVNLIEIEDALDSFPQINKVKIYKTRKAELKIEITERNPICRIFPEKGKSIYIDENGKFMPTSKQSPARVMIINGHITIPKQIIKNKTKIDTLTQIKQIFNLTKYIQKDEFLKAQIQQMYIDSMQNITLIPRVGNQKIMFGKTTNYKTKLYRLKYFYFNIIGKMNWNKYKKIDLRFKKQIIATKK